MAMLNNQMVYTIPLSDIDGCHHLMPMPIAAPPGRGRHTLVEAANVDLPSFGFDEGKTMVVSVGIYGEHWGKCMEHVWNMEENGPFVIYFWYMDDFPKQFDDFT